MMEKNVPNFIKIERSDISKPLTSIMPDIITLAVWLTTIGGATPRKLELTHFHSHSFEKNKICYVIARLIEYRKEAATTNRGVV